MGESGQDNNKERLSELERQRPDGSRHADAAGCGPAATAVRALVPSRITVVESQATDVPAIEPDELGERANARILASMVFRVATGACAHRLEGGLPEQALDKRARSGVIQHEPIVSREGKPELAQIGEVGRTIA